MKKIALFVQCVIGSLILQARLATSEKVSGEFYVVSGLRVRRWYRCRELTGLTVWSYFEPKYHILIDNAQFELSLTDVEVGCIAL
jgi:hypothetical protein